MIISDPVISIGRIVLIALGILLFYLGCKGTLEPLIMIPMGFGMVAINAGALVLAAGVIGNIFVDPIASDGMQIMELLQVNFLQPIYTFTFSNGLIACLVFMGIGVLADLGYVLAYPFTSMLIAFMAELGTILVFPLAVAMGFSFGDAASISIIGGADGPMVLYTSLMLSKDLFVPITIVAYLYLSLTYGLYPYLLRIMIPKHIRSIKVTPEPKVNQISSNQKLAFSIVACLVLCFLFPVAAPLFMSFFLGTAIRESGVKKYKELLENVFLYSATLFLGLLLGVLCEAQTILNPQILPLLVLGSLALLISGIGGIMGGYLVYWISGKKMNPIVGIAGVSCVPTTAKVAQKEASKANVRSVIMPFALGANVCGVITTAILTGLYVALILS